MSTDSPSQEAPPANGKSFFCWEYWQKEIRPRLCPFLLVLFLIFLAGAIVAIVNYTFIERLWVTIAALVPALLVLQHGVYLLQTKPLLDENDEADDESGLSSEGHAPSEAGRAQSDQDGTPGVNPRSLRKLSRKNAQDVANQEFGLASITRDYFLPTLLTAVAGLVPAFLLVHSEILAQQLRELEQGLEGGLSSPSEIRSGVVFGALGAYVYVLMMLGERTFQRDITSGAAVWSSIQLILGPVLGGVIAAVLAAGTQMTEFSRQAIYFIAGLSPRYVVSVVQDTVRRLFAAGAPLPKVKAIPLQTIRGIDQRIENRLFEEGITDGYLLAMANPIRLYRNTPFDLRQILAWSDECLLYAFVPEFADALQKDGVSGTVDLAYYWEMDLDLGPADAEEVQRQAMDRRKTRIHDLAERINADEKMLQEVIQRLDEDAQVQLIWSLYQAKEISARPLRRA